MAYQDWACLNMKVATATLNIVPTPPIETKQVQATTHQLPLADYLVVTWTEAETDAMARVLGAGQYFCHELNTNGNNFTPLLLGSMRSGRPTYFTRSSVTQMNQCC